MALKKQEFYEGAALHRLVRGGAVTSIRYKQPFFHMNERLRILLKYSTRGRSPWGFSFTPDEQALLEEASADLPAAIGLICGADGIAAISYEEYRSIAVLKPTAIHIACYRDHGKHYKVSGPDGKLAEKVPPSRWQRLLDA